jgi:hypothetical protein
MEKSFVAYSSRYPLAAPLPDMDGVQFNVDIMSPRQQQGPSPRFDGLVRHGDFADTLAGGSASGGVGADSVREHDDLELASLGRSDSEGRWARVLIDSLHALDCARDGVCSASGLLVRRESGGQQLLQRAEDENDR